MGKINLRIPFRVCRVVNVRCMWDSSWFSESTVPTKILTVTMHFSSYLPENRNRFILLLAFVDSNRPDFTHSWNSSKVNHLIVLTRKTPAQLWMNCDASCEPHAYTPRTWCTSAKRRAAQAPYNSSLAYPLPFFCFRDEKNLFTYCFSQCPSRSQDGGVAKLIRWQAPLKETLKLTYCKT